MMKNIKDPAELLKELSPLGGTLVRLNGQTEVYGREITTPLVNDALLQSNPMNSSDKAVQISKKDNKTTTRWPRGKKICINSEFYPYTDIIPSTNKGFVIASKKKWDAWWAPLREILRVQLKKNEEPRDMVYSGISFKHNSLYYYVFISVER